MTGYFEKGRWVDCREPAPVPVPEIPSNYTVPVHLSTIRRRDEHMLKQKATIEYYRNMNVWERIKFAIHPGTMRR